jgi:tRNA G18 (ribose-2'-O)-methylase SpoU
VPGGGTRIATVISVDDPGDPRLSDYRHLRDADLRRRLEPEGGFFVAEGVTVVRRLLRSGFPLRSILVGRERLPGLAAELDGHAVTVYVVAREVMSGVAGFDLHRGVVAAADRLPPVPLAAVLASARALAVLEGINDHENLGSIFRSAAALGVEGILLDPTCADPYYRRCVRVSMGAVLVIPFTRVAPWPGALAEVRAAGFSLLALTPAEQAVPIEEVRLPPGARPALLLGAEGPGLSAASLAMADRAVRIPLTRAVDSLNVGHAAAVAFHRLVGPPASPAP